MSVPVNTLLLQVAPLGGLALLFLLLGSLIHTGQESETVKIGTLLECSRAAQNVTPFQHQASEFVTGFYETAIFIALAAPLVPFALDPLRKWNDVKTQAVGAHLLGQSSSFGISEVLRYVGYWPNDLFFDRCNLTESECLEKSLQTLYLMAPTKRRRPEDSSSSSSTTTTTTTTNQTLCSRPNARGKDIYDSLHTFPNYAGSMLGSGLISFFLCVFFWSRLKLVGSSSSSSSSSNSKSRAPSTFKPTHASRKTVFVISFLMLCATTVYFVCAGNSQEETVSQKMLSVFQGALMQALISAVFLMQQQQQKEEELPPTIEGPLFSSTPKEEFPMIPLHAVK